jgi:hypothetical protein
LWNILSFKRFSRIRATQIDHFIYVSLSRHSRFLYRTGVQGSASYTRIS